MYIYIYIYIYAYIHVHVCIHTFMHNNTFMLIFSYAHTYLYDSEKCFVPLTVGGGIRCIYTHTPTYLHTYTHTCIYLYSLHMHTYTHACVHIIVYFKVSRSGWENLVGIGCCSEIFVPARTRYTYIHTYTHIYIHTCIYIHTYIHTYINK